MKHILSLFILMFSIATSAVSQGNFDYTLELNPVNISGLPGLHSYAFAQSNGKWLVIGGRKDGLHARQPFNSFPSAQNNTDIYVIDINTQQYWFTSISSLPTGIKEQLQSTNINFYQDSDTLYLIGGYAFSATENDHVTFPNLTTLVVSDVVDAIINASPIAPYFKQYQIIILL